MDKSKTSAKQTLVEEGTELKGTLKSTCQVVVNGTIDGQITAPSLMIAATGTVLGIVKANSLRSEGTLAGDIDADDVFLSGTVRSNTMIRAKKLEVKLAPERGKLEVTFGECLMEVGEDPAHAAAADEARKEDASPAMAAQMAAAPAAPAEGPSPMAAAPVEAAAPVRAAEGPEMPSWSEPPNGEAGAEMREEEKTSGGSSENGAGRRSKKGGDRRDSQAPPAA